MSYILLKYLPLFVYLLVVWLVRWFFVPRTRRLQLISAGFAVVVIVMVLGVEHFTTHGDWIRLTVLGLWLCAASVVSLSKRKTSEPFDDVPLFVIVSLFTGALFVILFGIQRLKVSNNSQFYLGYSVLLLSMVLLILAGCVASRRSRSSGARTLPIETSKRNGELRKPDSLTK